MEMERRREGYVENYMPKRTRGEQLRGWWRTGESQKTKGQGHEHFCDTGMSARNGNFGTDRNTTTKASSVRKQLGTKNSKSKEGRMADDRLPPRVVELREEGRRRRLRPRHIAIFIMLSIEQNTVSS